MQAQQAYPLRNKSTHWAGKLQWTIAVGVIQEHCTLHVTKQIRYLLEVAKYEFGISRIL